MGRTILNILLVSIFVVLAVAGPPLQVQKQWTTISRKLGLQPPKSDLFDIEPRFRLPEKIETVRYDLRIITFLNKVPDAKFTPWTAPGNIKITFIAKEVSNTIALHKDKQSVQLTVAPITVTKVGGGAVQVIKTDYDENGLWVIELGSELEKDAIYELYVDFITTLPTEFTGSWSRTGLYGAKYTDDKGVEHYLATTQFETIGFRKMAPAFDEPKFKAIFKIWIGRPEDHIALSNSGIENPGVSDPELPAGYVWDEFKETVKMSTYLIAMVVSQYGYEEADLAILGKPVRIYGPPHLMAIKGGVYSADTSAKILKSYEDRYSTKYAMDKMDSVAIPRAYFEFGAMENWGLNTYLDNILLYYPEGPSKSTENTRMSINSVLSHELGHQWFGNLVTTIWWDNIYLNEGFATYVSYFGVEATEPEYDPLNQFLYDAVQPALRVDAGPSSHPVINTATEEEITTMSIFDSMSYEKGASVIRMMQNFLSLETFTKGLVKYLDIKKFDNAHQDELFEVLTQQAQEDGLNLDIKTIMDTYTLQKGFPLIRVAVAGAGKLYISQERYRNNINQNRELDPNELWEVPLAIATSDNPSVTQSNFWIHKNTSLVTVSTEDTNKWIIVNPGGYGYNRVLYDTKMTNLIQDQLTTDATVFSALTRSKLADDYFRFAEERYITWPTALGMTKGLGKTPADSDHTFWVPVINTFAGLLPFLGSEIDSLKNYFLPKVDAELEYVGWAQGANEHGIKVLLRASLLDWSCTFESPKCIQAANDLFTKWVTQPESDPNPIPVDLQAIYYCAAIATGPKENFAFALNQYRKIKTDSLAVEHRNRLVDSLSCSSSFEDLLWLTRNSIEANEFGQEHLSNIIRNVFANSVGRNLSFGFIRDNWQKLVDYTAADPEKIQTNVISSAVSAFSVHQNSQEDITQLRALMADIEAKNKPHYDVISGSLNSSVNRIEANMKWIAAYRDSINEWFDANADSP